MEALPASAGKDGVSMAVTFTVTGVHVNIP
jgi:hypothetical protein